jgi:hypothetical protein
MNGTGDNIKHGKSDSETQKLNVSLYIQSAIVELFEDDREVKKKKKEWQRMNNLKKFISVE